MSDFAEQIKTIEMEEAGRRMTLPLPVIARLDGRAFHTFTRKMQRPFDSNMTYAMQETTKALVQEFHAEVGYCQSDEITLVWRRPVLFDGRFQKLTSVLAGYCSAVFSRIATATYLQGAPGWTDIVPCFDCRVFQVESLDRAIDILAWREYDATKNSVAMAAQSMYSHKELLNKHRENMMDMMHAKGVNWNDYPASFKRGSYFKRIVKMKALSTEELARIPAKYRTTALVPRGVVVNLELEPIRSYPPEVIREILFPGVPQGTLKETDEFAKGGSEPVAYGSPATSR